MVHALREAHRVLEPGGLLVDVRPGPSHRRIGIERNKRWRYVTTAREDLSDDHAANAAVKAVVAEGLFRREAFDRFELRRMIGTLRNLRDLMSQFTLKYGAMDRVLERVERALERAGPGARIVTVGPLEVRVLRKR